MLLHFKSYKDQELVFQTQRGKSNLRNIVTNTAVPTVHHQ